MLVDNDVVEQCGKPVEGLLLTMIEEELLLNDVTDRRAASDWNELITATTTNMLVVRLQDLLVLESSMLQFWCVAVETEK